MYFLNSVPLALKQRKEREAEPEVQLFPFWSGVLSIFGLFIFQLYYKLFHSLSNITKH